jgi:mono/diheme cytochrome c family protein
MSGFRFVRRSWCLSPALLLALVACSHSAPAASPGPASPSVSTPTTVAVADPYHPPPRDTVSVALYKGWQQYMLQCARCHGDDALGTSFAPSLVQGLGPEGQITSREEFMTVLTNGRPDKGMPSDSTMGLDPVYLDGLYQYLRGRADGQLHGGRPARREN